MMQKSIFV